LGLFLLVLNAICLWLVTVLVPGVEVRSFGAAFLSALIISIVSWVLSMVVGGLDRSAKTSRRA
jgi:putative membrane protein